LSAGSVVPVRRRGTFRSHFSVISITVTGPTVLNSVSTTPGASIVHAVGDSGVSGANNPFALQNG
jgi:hypothetical protein